MNYWLTTHWPHRKGDPENNPDIWLPDGRQQPGAEISIGDLVLIYESKTARTLLRKRPDGSEIRVHSELGNEGVICIGRVIAPLIAEADTNLRQKYADGTKIWWRWHAAAEVVSRSGFVARHELAVILGYKPTFPFRGFGEQQSGLKRITEETFKTIVERFNQAQPIKLPEHPISPDVLARWGNGEESETHRKLKEFVASDPAKALNEQGLCTLAMEYGFASKDRADIVLLDQYNRIVAVEIEPEVNASDEVGALQAIKYRYMLEWCTNRSRGDSRAILIAHKIHPAIRKKCAEYGVECCELPRERLSK